MMASRVSCPCVSPDDFDLQNENELLGLDCLHQKERLINAEECASIGKTHLGDSLRLELVTSSILAKDDYKRLDKSRKICDICERYRLLWTVNIQNLRALVDVYHKHNLVTKTDAKIVASDGWRWREVAVSKNHDTAVKIADILYHYDVCNYARQILILADVYHEEELVTKEEAEKAASDVGKWREIAVTKDVVTATRIADILDECEMSIEAKHIQILVDVYHKEQLVTKEEAEKVASGEKKWGEVAFNRDVLKRIIQIMKKHKIYATPSELSDALNEPLYRNVGNLNINGEHQSNMVIRTVKYVVSYFYDISDEGALSRNCWLPFDYVPIRVGKDGGTFDLCSDGQTKLTVPRNAVQGESAEIRCAIIGSGPFQLPPNYTLGSFVVYVYYNPAEIIIPVTLSLPTWYGGQVTPGSPPSDGLSFAVASHTLGRDKQYSFQLVSGGEFHSSRIHDVSIDGHSSLYTIVFEESAKRLFLATHLKRIREETTHKIIVSYASPTWIKIYETIYREDAILSKDEFKFQNPPSGKLVGELQQEDAVGNGWAVAIDGCPEVHQTDISYEGFDLETANDLKDAVEHEMYPPEIRFIVHNTVGREEITTPKLVNCTIRGADRPLQFPLHVLERVSDNVHKRPPSSATSDSRRPKLNVFDSRQFMDSFKDPFLRSVAAKDIAGKLKMKCVIPDSVYLDIVNQQTSDDNANLKLFSHLHQHGAHTTIQSLCDIMTNEAGYPNMNTLGRAMNDQLPASSCGT